MTIELLAQQGREKIHNGLAAIDTAQLKKMRNQALRNCFNHMDEIRYRKEFVARIHGKTFINDAASRSVNSTWYTLESIDGPIIWILNAYLPADQQADLSKLVQNARGHVRMMVCIGRDSSWIHRQFDHVVPTIVDVATMREAVERAYYSAIETATVVYSPALPSDLSPDEEGMLFRHEVNEL